MLEKSEEQGNLLDGDDCTELEYFGDMADERMEKVEMFSGVVLGLRDAAANEKIEVLAEINAVKDALRQRNAHIKSLAGVVSRYSIITQGLVSVATAILTVVAFKLLV